MQLTTNFSLHEMCRSETASRHGLTNLPDETARARLVRLCVKILEPVRAHYGKPFRPNSGYRGPELNKLIGGSMGSQHMKGEAVDFEIPGISNLALALWVRENLTFDQLILECYTKDIPTSGWVHVSLTDDNRNDVMTYSNRQYSVGLKG